jgi:hypothetical protein
MTARQNTESNAGDATISDTPSETEMIDDAPATT